VGGEERREDMVWNVGGLERKREMQREERWERIEKGKFSKFYRLVKGEGIPRYLKKD